MPFSAGADTQTLVFHVLDRAVREVSEATFGSTAARSLALQAVMALRIKLAIGEGQKDPSELQRLALNAIENLY